MLCLSLGTMTAFVRGGDSASAAGQGELCTSQSADCDNNGICDAEEIAFCKGDPACGDCNGNGVPDECDISDGTSNDCNDNGTPDDCEIKLAAGPIVYFVFETSNDHVFRLQDLNDNGDANDPGEGWIYGDLDGVEGIDVDQRNGDLYTCQTNGMIYRYRDLNGDGDALDDGEKVLYADDIASGMAPNEASLENIAVGENNNTVYTVFENEDVVVWHRDMNGDGDALDAGEFGLFAHVGCDLEEITVDASTGDVYVGSDNEDPVPQALGEGQFCQGGDEEVWRLVDVNGDGDAEDPGDIKELVGDAGHEALDFNDNSGELFAGEEDFSHFSRVLGGVISTYGNLDCCAEALAVDPISSDVFTGDEIGDLLVESQTFCGLIWRFRDLNGDGDAVDDGERTFFHDFLFNDNYECETEALAAYGGRDIDCNDNGIPDDCEPDCDGDGVPDDCDVTPETEPPVITGCPQSISGSLDANCGFPAPDLSLQVDATDNCTATENLVITTDPADLSALGVGDNVVTVTVTDEAGNSTSCTVMISIAQGDCNVGGEPSPPPSPQQPPCDPTKGGLNILFSLLFHAPVCGMGCPLMILLTLCGMATLRATIRRRRR